MDMKSDVTPTLQVHPDNPNKDREYLALKIEIAKMALDVMNKKVQYMNVQAKQGIAQAENCLKVGFVHDPKVSNDLDILIAKLNIL